jgi:hypothetical protein
MPISTPPPSPRSASSSLHSFGDIDLVRPEGASTYEPLSRDEASTTGPSEASDDASSTGTFVMHDDVPDPVGPPDHAPSHWSDHLPAFRPPRKNDLILQPSGEFVPRSSLPLPQLPIQARPTHVDLFGQPLPPDVYTPSQVRAHLAHQVLAHNTDIRNNLMLREQLNAMIQGMNERDAYNDAQALAQAQAIDPTLTGLIRQYEDPAQAMPRINAQTGPEPILRQYEEDKTHTTQPTA